MKPYEIREVDQQRVFVKEIRPGFYLCNNMLIAFDKPVEIPDVALRWSLPESSVAPAYAGADKGFIVSAEGPDAKGLYLITTDMHVNMLSDSILLADVDTAVREYTTWRKNHD
jgi:hypothetical protein